MVTASRDLSRRHPALVLVSVGMLLMLSSTPALGEEIQYLPERPSLILSANVSGFLNSKICQELKNQFPLPELDREIEKGATARLGVPLANVSRVLVCATAGEKEQTHEIMFMVSTFKPVNAEEIKSARKGAAEQKLVTFKEVKVGNFTLYEETYKDVPDAKEKQQGVQEGLSFCIVDPKLVVFGKVPELKKILERNKKPALSASMQAALNEADLTSPVALLIDVEGLPQWSRDAAAKHLPKVVPDTAAVINSTKYIAVKFTEAGTINGSATIAYKDAKSAAGGKEMAEGLVKNIKASLNDVKLPPNMTEKLNAMRQILDAVKLTVADNQLQGTFSAEPTAVAQFLTFSVGTPPGVNPQPPKDKKPSPP